MRSGKQILDNGRVDEEKLHTECHNDALPEPTFVEWFHVFLLSERAKLHEVSYHPNHDYVGDQQRNWHCESQDQSYKEQFFRIAALKKTFPVVDPFLGLREEN